MFFTRNIESDCSKLGPPEAFVTNDIIRYPFEDTIIAFQYRNHFRVTQFKRSP